MAPKKTNQNELKEAQAATSEWSISKCSRQNLASLVLGGLLQERDLINWRLPLRDPFPMENVNEIVSFCSFSERGLAFPTCSFFRGLLYYYGIELQHLNPNLIRHISIFIHFCEAFLGIEPHWALFRYLFRMKPQPNAKNPSAIGGAGIQLRQHASDDYISYKFPSNVPGWKQQWFYIANHAPQLPVRSSRAPVQRAEWTQEPAEAEMDQVKELLELIFAHKEAGVTGASVMLSFFKRRIQPIQQRHTFGFEYMGTEDPSRMCAEELEDDTALVRTRRILLDVETVPYDPTGFSAQNRAPSVSDRLLDFFVGIENYTRLIVLSQDVTALNQSHPPQPDQPRPCHLLPSAAAAAERAKTAGNESTESSRPTGERARPDNSPGSSVELSDNTPLVPRRRREMRKRKASTADLAG
jgi:hypothetical protein